jgi:hypothetical protein
MSPPLVLAYAVGVLLAAYQLATMYRGDRYVCPSCGARSAGRHSADCPWST